MATFFTSLWESIFTPGPTPTLLVATNATFAALQVVLALMLFATHSIHFVVLSGLCAGLWVSINWFARELKAHQLQQEQQKQEEEKKRRRPKAPQRVDSSESETEVEGVRSAGSLRKAAPAAVSTEVEAEEVQGELKQRAVAAEVAAVAGEPILSPPSQGHKSSVSTEDEWEKVSENEKDK